MFQYDYPSFLNFCDVDHQKVCFSAQREIPHPGALMENERCHLTFNLFVYLILTWPQLFIYYLWSIFLIGLTVKMNSLLSKPCCLPPPLQPGRVHILWSCVTVFINIYGTRRIMKILLTNIQKTESSILWSH